MRNFIVALFFLALPAVFVSTARAQTLPSPSVATPTTAGQATPKGYVDSAISTVTTTANTGVTNAATAQSTANAAQTTANAALPNTIPALTALTGTLPTTLPATAGKLWLNGGVLSIS